VGSSGLACSRRADGVLWTHNDSGGCPRLFAFNTSGKHLVKYEIAGVPARDWEDLASFSVGKKSYLVIGDVGDSARMRTHYHVYVVEEPPVRQDQGPALIRAPVLMDIGFDYDDGPQDCESLAVDPTDRTIYLVSMSDKPVVHSLPMPKRPPTTPLKARTVATLDIKEPTGMDMSPDGLRAVIITYGDAYELTRKPDEKWARAFSRKPRRLPMPERRQGESICYGRDGQTLYLTSELSPAPLWEVPVVAPLRTNQPTRR